MIAWGAWLVPTLLEQEDAGPASEGTKTAEVETSVGVSNVTDGDTQYTGAVGASTNDKIKIQIYLRNMDIEQPLNDVVVRWQTEELKDGLYVVTSTVITETGNEYMADAAIYVWTDTPAKRPALVGDIDWGEVLRYPDTDGEYREQLVRSSSELTGSVEIPALSAAAGRDAITLTTNLRAAEE